MTPEERAREWLAWDNRAIMVKFLEPGRSEYDELIESLTNEIQAAIREERERCAKIAEGVLPILTDRDSYGCGYRTAVKTIAARIRDA
jgi:hypothetical protein